MKILSTLKMKNKYIKYIIFTIICHISCFFYFAAKFFSDFPSILTFCKLFNEGNVSSSLQFTILFNSNNLIVYD